MSLVTYSSSDDEAPAPGNGPDEHQNHVSKKRKLSNPTSSSPFSSTLPPPPASFANLYATPVRTSTVDDPSLHGGRQRTTPHVAGLWPSHIYIEWTPSSEVASLLERVIAKCHAPPFLRSRTKADTGKAEVQALLRSPLGAPAPLHISLSTSLQLRTEQRESFLEKLKATVHSAGIEAFQVRPTGLRWVGNGRGTRWFLVLGVRTDTSDGKNSLGKVLSQCNEVAIQFGFDPLYEAGPNNSQDENHKRKRGKEPLSRPGSRQSNGVNAADTEHLAKHCHVSIAWCLAPKPDEEEGNVANLQAEESLIDMDEQLLEEVKAVQIHVVTVKVKVGNTIVDIPLGSSGNEKGESSWFGL